MKISIIGLGYVGLSLSYLISQKYTTYAYDIDSDKIEKLKKNIPNSLNNEVNQFLDQRKLDLKITNNIVDCLKNSTFVVIAVPTNYDTITNNFNTDIVEEVIKDVIKVEPKASIIIKSTIPIGFTEKIINDVGKRNIYFSPEFLRENKALKDNLYPSRIIIGDKTEKSEKFAEIMKECSNSSNTKIIYMKSKEAEATKLFSNAFLAMRVSFFNELDSFSETNDLNSKKIIEGVSLDPRIGNYYNNPSFGYGGYCLPKDTQQLLNNYNNIPNNIISGVVKANKTRKEFIVQSILKKKPNIVGVYRLIMKSDSDNFRESAIIDVIDELIKNGIEVIVYEPLISLKIEFPYNITHKIEDLKTIPDLIIANRYSEEIKHLQDKLYTRDIFQEN